MEGEEFRAVLQPTTGGTQGVHSLRGGIPCHSYLYTNDQNTLSGDKRLVTNFSFFIFNYDVLVFKTTKKKHD